VGSGPRRSLNSGRYNMIEGHTLAFEGPDTFFKDYMTLADVYRHPGHHFDFHAANSR
jgi:hypothetical protein